MKQRIVWYATVKEVEERAARKWVRGVGKDAEFKDKSEGWYVTFEDWPAAAHVGMNQPDVKPGDRVKFSMEKA